MNELPTMMAASANSRAYNLQGAQGLAQNSLLGQNGPNDLAKSFEEHFKQKQLEQNTAAALHQTINSKPKEITIMPRRIVQVFIADPNENIPMADSLLYKGESQMTDMTDQELFFEIDIKSILEKHNEKRAKTVDKKVKERTEYLEPAKVRDLKMVVVTVASF